MSEKRPSTIAQDGLTTAHLGRVRPAVALNGLTTSHLKSTPATAAPPPKPPASTQTK